MFSCYIKKWAWAKHLVYSTVQELLTCSTTVSDNFGIFGGAHVPQGLSGVV